MSIQLRTQAVRRIRRLFSALAAGSALLLAPVSISQSAELAEVGDVGPSYAGATAPTGQKPQSKLWFTDGKWWGILFDTETRDFHIFRYYWSTREWVDTGILVDERASAYTDVLWDGTHLYVAAAGMNPSNTGHSPRITRFSYSPATEQWSRDSGYPVTVASGGVEAAVIAKDSTGLVWMTFTQGAKVWLTHSSPGDDRSWVPKYQLPAPAGQSNVDPDDISAIVAYDGNKIGVLWSNKRDETMYWATHVGGTDDRLWSVEIAYRQPEGADDHINLRSITGDPAGRVYAVVKTSMDHANDPLIHVLVLAPDGSWSSHVFGTKGENHTRAVVMIDSEHRELYVFAAQPCCAGGDIYYKKTSLDDPQFEPGLGTLFMHSAAHPEINNPTSTKQNVTSATGLLVLASDDETRTYVHNRFALGDGPPTDTEPPDTVIDSGPPAMTPAAEATFEFHATETGSTFVCQLDAAPAQPCSSPATYDGLSEGNHTFEVSATDQAGNQDPTPATYTWTIDTAAALFEDDFSSGGFAAGSWEVHTGGTGMASVEDGAVTPGDPGARLTSTTAPGSAASIRKILAAPRSSLTLSFDGLVAADRSGQFFALAKLYDAAGRRVLSLLREADGAVLTIDHLGGSATVGSLPTGQVTRISVHVEQVPGATDRVQLSLDDVVVFSTATADLGDTDLRRFRLGDDSLRRALDYRVDNVEVTG